MEGSKSALLVHLSSLINDWSGRHPLTRAERKAFDEPLRLLGFCSIDGLEQYRRQAFRECLAAASGRWVVPGLREAWLVETWCWQRLLETGMACDDRPALPSRNPVYEQALISHQRPEYGLPRSPF